MSGRLNRISWTNCLRIASWLMLGIALGLLLYAQWIPAKALLAQQLIQRTWAAHLAAGADQNTTGSGVPAPWPWADWHPVAQLSLSPETAPLFVLTGVEGASLAFGPGLHPQGAQPNESGTIVIAGHRDTHFQALRTLNPGDTVKLQTPQGQWRSFHVTNMNVVDSAKEGLSLDEATGSRLQLITCYPFDAMEPGGTLRYVVTAEEDSITSL